MKKVFLLALAFSSPAFATQLACVNGNENLAVRVNQTKVSVSGYTDGAISRDTRGLDCAYRSGRYACYQDGQLMVNIELGLVNGTKKSGVMYVQTDTDDNTDANNHGLLGVRYNCVAK